MRGSWLAAPSNSLSRVMLCNTRRELQSMGTPTRFFSEPAAAPSCATTGSAYATRTVAKSLRRMLLFIGPLSDHNAPAICISAGAFSNVLIMFADHMPVRANDFSQSADDGPRILPSMYAKPGQRVHPPTCPQPEQVVRSFNRIERTSFITGESFQIARKRSFRRLPVGSGNCTQGNTSA